MSDAPNNSSDRLEGLLRQWGSERAVAEAPEPALPPTPRRAGRVLTVFRWGPLAAAAMLFVAAGAFYVATDRALREHTMPLAEGPTRQSGQTEAEEMDNKLRERREIGASDELAHEEGYYRSVAQERDELASEVELLRGLLAEAEESQRAAGAAATDDRLRELDGRDPPASSGEHLEAAQIETDASDDRAFADAGGSGEAEARDPEHSLGEDYDRQTETISALYLSLVAPDEKGLAAIQTAAGKRDLLGRCSRLQRRFRDSRFEAVLDRVEVVLTRLDLLDIASGQDVRNLAALTRGDFSEQLTAAIAEADDGELRMFLTEVSVVLQGVDHVA